MVVGGGKIGIHFIILETERYGSVACRKTTDAHERLEVAIGTKCIPHEENVLKERRKKRILCVYAYICVWVCMYVYVCVW